MRPGRHSKTIDVYSNDPERPRISLKLNFNVIRHVSIAPPVLAMRLLESEENAVFALTATSHWTKPIVLKAASSDGSGEVALVPQEVVVPPGGNANFQLSVRVTQGTGQSHLKGTALIETDDAVEQILPVRYFIQLRKGSGT
jgi:hypothetical protein